ncbi:MAG: Flp pilus assembly protein CpaB [Rhodocyclaceae bacterium]|nr:Flp pilus assembly protein CpaB [Rhodocyclaceae bacterium]
MAFILVVGAIVAAFLGYRMSTQPPPVQPVAPTETVVQSLKALHAGEPIRVEDIALKSVPAKPVGSFVASTQVVGQMPMVDIPAGETLTRAQFPSPGNLLHSLHAGERAVAIKVDEVVGLGGFAQPGDRVDVLLYLRGAQEIDNASSAQVVLAGVRLLAYGESTQPAAQAPTEGENMAAHAAASAADKVPNRPRTTTSAVLAIPEASASKLMLAANSGTLRLSLRPAEPIVAVSDQPYLVHLAELAKTTRPVPAKPGPRGVGTPGIMLYEGTTVHAVHTSSR